MKHIEYRRLSLVDMSTARRLFALMADVFETEAGPLGDEYLHRLLGRNDFWALGAFIGDDVVGGLTAHTLPMTTSERLEVFIYDIAVRVDRQRHGIGRGLVSLLREMAAAEDIDVVFVAADEDDAHAVAFYRALGGVESPVRFFTFSPAQRDC